VTRRRWILLFLVVALVGAAGHWSWWYMPRARAGAPELAASRALLADPSWAAVLWVPWPHQNLGALDERVGDVRAWIGLLAEVAGRPAPRLPRFGPWSAPPAREWVVAVDAGGGVRSVAAVYPSVALLARAAGSLARNPWLGGGEVELGGGRRGRVTWHGRIWSFETDGASPIRTPPEGAGLGEEAFAALQLRRPPDPLPEGLWWLRRDPDGAFVAELGRVPEPLDGGPEGADPPAAWLAEVAPGPVGGPWALLLWEGGGTIEGFPRAALVARGGGQPFALPGARIARLAGLDPDREEIDDFASQAFDPEALAGARAAARWLLERLPGPAQAGPWRAFLAGADPGRAGAALRRAARHLGRVPVLGERESARLSRAADLLAPWEGCGELSLEVWRDPDAARLRICRPAAPR
jgi:hypothetical protein